MIKLHSDLFVSVRSEMSQEVAEQILADYDSTLVMTEESLVTAAARQPFPQSLLSLWVCSSAYEYLWPMKRISDFCSLLQYKQRCASSRQHFVWSAADQCELLAGCEEME